jgi:copper homeostasis protein
MIVEICLDSVESAVAADRGGADRIELCEQLEVGGLTPPMELLREVRAAVKCKVHVMIRLQPGDFAYSAAEVAVMLRQVEAVKALGADGVVVGVLDRNGKIDRADTHELVRRARPMAVTFHRAFDEAPNAERALNDVIVAGCERVLTTGGSKPDGTQFRTAMDGADRLRVLVREGAGRITILAGGGIRAGNVRELIARTGVTEVHSSLIDYTALREGERFVVREERVREFIAAAHAATART